jgi:putative endonuclease
MHYVYRLRSGRFPNQECTGSTNDLKNRLRQHNLGQNISTAPFRPWRLTFYAAFESPTTARAFERYLKTGSGKAFARNRLCPINEQELSATDPAPDPPSPAAANSSSSAGAEPGRKP